jgi:predicted enzyme related to lactoylglutathione lyase
MPTRFTHIVVDCAEMRPTAQFWSTLLGWPITFEDDEELYIEGEYMGIVFGEVPEPKTVKNRVHLDLASSSPEQQQEIVDRALELGARRVDIGQGDTPFVVLADPEGNEFCVLDPRPSYSYDETGPVAAIVQDCADPAAIAPLWSAALGRPIDRQSESFVAMRLADGRGPWLALVRNPDPKTLKNRVHIDVAPYAADDQDAEVERLIALGAYRIDIGQGDVPWECLADPEGNEVCVLSPRD